MVILKLLLLTILAAFPFVYSLYIKGRSRGSKRWRNLFSLVASTFPWLRRIKRAISKFLHRVYDGMKRFKSARKFYMMLILLVMIVFQVVDFHANNVLMEQIGEYDKYHIQIAMCRYGGLLSSSLAEVLAFPMSMGLFFYAPSNWLLGKLRKSQPLFLCTGMAAVAIFFVMPQWMIVAELIDITLIASYFYPEMQAQGHPNGGRRIVVDDGGKQALREVA